MCVLLANYTLSCSNADKRLLRRLSGEKLKSALEGATAFVLLRVTADFILVGFVTAVCFTRFYWSRLPLPKEIIVASKAGRDF